MILDKQVQQKTYIEVADFETSVPIYQTYVIIPPMMKLKLDKQYISATTGFQVRPFSQAFSA